MILSMREGKSFIRRWLRAAVVPACVALALAIFVHYSRGLEAWHRRGEAQPLLSRINAMTSVMRAPGGIIGEAAWNRIQPTVPSTAWGWAGPGLFLCVHFSIYYAALLLLRQLVFRRSVAGRTPPPVRSGDAAPPAGGPPPALTRRDFLLRGTQGLAAGATGVGLYSLFVEPRWFDVSERSFPLRGLPSALDGLRCVQITDIHLGPWLSTDYVKQIVDAANALRPDLVLLTGDYIIQTWEYLDPVVAALSGLRPRIGTLAVLGNHDWIHGSRATRQAFARIGVSFVDNDRRFVTTDRSIASHATEGLCVAGVGDLYFDRQDFGRALQGVPESMPRIVLSHNPDAAEDPELLQNPRRIDLMLCGHTHGGQIRLPLLGTPVTMSRFGQKYASGLNQGPACPVFTCRGLGMTGLPLRLGVRPEVALFEFRKA